MPSPIDPKTKLLLVQRAQLMRACPTESEQKLWLALRSGQLDVPFRRQVPIGHYIVDFVAPRAKLVVEVDGRCHEHRRTADARRDRKLARLGYRVLRLDAALVRRQLPLALARIRRALEEER